METKRERCIPRRMAIAEGCAKSVRDARVPAAIMHLVKACDLELPPLGLVEGASLFLDFDGTLVELAERPESVRANAHLRDVMALLHHRLNGRLAVVSGRAAEQVRSLFGDPHFIVAGCHGLEIHFAGGRTIMAAQLPDLHPILEAMRALARDWPGVLVEEKPFGAALHFRQNPAASAACIALVEAWTQQCGLALQTGKMMIEARLDSGDKGSAVMELMADPPFKGTRPIFVGDDDTDEAGFAAALALGGAGIIVGDGRATAASYRLADVAAVLRWLDAISGT